MNNIFFGKGWAFKVYKSEFYKSFDLLSLQYLDIKKYPYLLESSSRGNLKIGIQYCFINRVFY